jgi:hypothetical protein
MSLPYPSISKILWLLPVVAACSPPIDIAKEEGVGGSATGGSSAIPTGGSNAAPTGGSSTQATSATGGSSLAGTGGTPSTGGIAALGGSSTSATGGSSAQPTSDTGGVAPTGGAPSTGGTSTQATSATGGGNPTGGAASTGGATSTGGSSSAGVRSRVIVVDPQSSRFGAYDAEGQLVHDYTALLDFPDWYDDRVVCVDTMAYSWDGTASSPFFAATVLAPPGQDPPLASTEIIVRAASMGGTKPMVTVRIASMSGQVTDEFSIIGNWEGFLSSPSRQYLQGGISGTTGIILRRSDHGSVWQGPLFQAGFSPDDKHLIVIPTSSVDALLTVELGTGRVTNFDLSSLPAGFELPTDLYVRGTFNSGAILTGSRADGSGYTLYWAGWDGKIAPFDPTLPVGVNEWAVAANRDATRLAFSRNSQSSTTASWFEFDVGTLSIRALPRLNDTSGDCYDTSVTSYYTLSGGTLSSCGCATASCTSFASWTPPTDLGWRSDVAVSPLRGMVGVEYNWISQMMATTTANSNLYSNQGTLLTSANGATFAFDRLDQLALVSAYMPTYTKAVFSAASGRTTLLNNPARLAIGYE